MNHLKLIHKKNLKILMKNYKKWKTIYKMYLFKIIGLKFIMSKFFYNFRLIIIFTKLF